MKTLGLVSHYHCTFYFQKFRVYLSLNIVSEVIRCKVCFKVYMFINVVDFTHSLVAMNIAYTYTTMHNVELSACGNPFPTNSSESIPQVATHNSGA